MVASLLISFQHFLSSLFLMPLSSTFSSWFNKQSFYKHTSPPWEWE